MSDNIIPKVDILGIPVFAGRFLEAVDIVLENMMKARNYCISATGAHGIVHSSENYGFKKVLQRFFLNLPDGMPNVWIGKLKGRNRIERCYGPDFFAEIIKLTADKNIYHFLCGGNAGVADKLKLACLEKFNNKNIVGTHYPPFLPVDEFDYKGIAEIINKSNSDILWIGLSTPKQEYFAYNISKYTNVKYIITVGAAFDFHVGVIRQAPRWMQKTGLEWFFRLLIEPKRLFSRYIYIVPKYIYLNILDFIKFVSK